MSFIEAVLLGVVQGITEFLPISSDGHLALGAQLLGREPDLSFMIFLHGATVLAMYAYFWTDIARLASAFSRGARERAQADRRLIARIVLGTVATGTVALALEPVVEPMAASPQWVGVWFMSNALVLGGGELLARRRPAPTLAERLGPVPAAAIGVMQGLAVLPGLSRSGSTIAAGVAVGLRREEAARFSFLLGVPIITLAAVRDLAGLASGSTTLPPWPVALSGFAAAALSGYLAIAVLLRWVRTRTLVGFAVYTGVLGAILLAMSVL